MQPSAIRHHGNTVAVDTVTTRGVIPQMDATLRSFKQRLENIEDRSNDPFGDVKNTLKSIEHFRQDFAEKVSKMYQNNIDQMSQAAKTLGLWHGQLKNEVSEYCDERNIKLHRACEQVLTRMNALELASSEPALEEHQQRLDSLETSSKT